MAHAYGTMPGNDILRATPDRGVRLQRQGSHGYINCMVLVIRSFESAGMGLKRGSVELVPMDPKHLIGRLASMLVSVPKEISSKRCFCDKSLFSMSLSQFER